MKLTNLEQLKAEAAANAAMPSLRPGESVTLTPDRWCPTCNMARGGVACGVCGMRTTTSMATDVETPTKVERRPIMRRTEVSSEDANVVVMSKRTRESLKSRDEVIREFWVDDKVDRGQWLSLLSSAVVALAGHMGPEDSSIDLAREAGKLADMLYFELWSRTNLG